MGMDTRGGNLFLLSLFITFLQIGLLAFTITLLVIHRRRIREFFKPGLILGAVCFVFSLPMTLFLLAGMDFSALLPASLGPEFAQMMTTIMLVAGVFSGLLGVGVVMCHYVIAAAEWDTMRPRPFPVFMRTGRQAWGRIGIAALVGAGAAGLSMAAGKLLNVGLGDLLQIQSDLLKEFNKLPEVLQFVLMLLFVVSAAVSEEILYRGALLGFLCRVSRDRTTWVLASIFTVSLLWAFMHVLNTDNPTFKLAQVFILGVVFAEFARRWSLESAMAAHISLNVTALLLGLLPVFQ